MLQEREVANGRPMFNVDEAYPVEGMAAFMRRPDIYWPASDALAPQPEAMGFEEHLTSPYVSTIACKAGDIVIGYVQFVVRTSIGAEIHVGFHPQMRGAIAKSFIEYAIALAFKQKGIVKLWAIIADDNVPAIRLARFIGFQHEGRIRGAIVREESRFGQRGLHDLVILGMSKTGTIS